MPAREHGVGRRLETPLQEASQIEHRVDIDFIGRGDAGRAYGGHLRAWSFRNVAGTDWFAEFRQTALDAVGRRFLPIYRMADGEYRFLTGRRYNFHRRPLLKEIAAVTAEKLRIKNPDRWITSWGETYPAADTRRLRAELVSNIRYLADHGILACYINDNGLNAFTEYNRSIPRFFARSGIRFDAENYVPFHFAPSLLINDGWRDFLVGRSVLVVTGLTSEKKLRIGDTLTRMGAGDVRFLGISSSASMTDILDLSEVEKPVDICLVAGGIGSANILRQLEGLQTLSLDIGGLMNCLANPAAKQHNGVIALPDIPEGFGQDDAN